MSQSTLRRAIGAVKDQTSIGLAKVGSSSSQGDLEVAIVKATSHNEYPAEEKHIREILSLTCYSRVFISACVNNLSKRLSKTSSWTVALKTLVLIQRLLAEGDPAYEQEIFFSTRRGTRLLNMCDFIDKSKTETWDLSAFVRTYALYLDERLEYRMQHKRGRRSRFSFDEDDEEQSRVRERGRYKERDKDKEVVVRSPPLSEMKTEQLFSKMQHLQVLLERFMTCRPTGSAKSHRIVIVALYPIVKESFQIYHDMTRILSVFIDRFIEMEVQECSKVYDIFCRVGKQYDELDLFYTWSKSIGIARSSEYPEIERVTAKKLELMDQFIKEKTKKKLGTQEKEVEKNDENELEEDMNEIKALPPPEGFNEKQVEDVVKEEIEQKQEQKEEKIVQTEVDLLDLGDDIIVTKQDYDENKLALALFDGELPTSNSTQALPWHAFDDESDWETTLVQSSSNLPNQKPSLGGGFDTLLLDSMYQQAPTSMQGVNGYGTMLALPAPTSSNNGSYDPFAASLAVAPPAYVQMTEIEKRQRLLAEEQAMWQLYANSGMQGHVGFTAHQQPSNLYMGGYQQNYYGNYH
ncbi:putative clathrin assembly protein At1g03050 [Trifolium pratense]|uniref:putative clathrin assembly protein At1g03050 n=1 Tax=Trifolium pratense TaxID=57577 RepID=UPI001E690DEB|nr:putative clathrin assembly protein At1g03050 [Trifolium pratense]